MAARSRLVVLWLCTLLMLTLCPHIQARRGVMGRGGSSRGFRTGSRAGYPPVQSRGYGARPGAGASPVRNQGTGGGVGAGAPPVQSQGSSNTGMKVAGAAAAGAVGGAMLGHGLSSMARPGYGYGGYGYSGYGYRGYGGHGEYSSSGVDVPQLRNETDTEFYTGASSSIPVSSDVMVLGSVVCFLVEHWIRGI